MAQLFSGISSLALIKSGASTLESDLASEKAGALGRLGQRLEDALTRLRAHDAGKDQGATRLDLVAEAGETAWLFITQREACGMRDQKAVIADYKIPRDVVARIGAFRPRPEGHKDDRPSFLKLL